MNGCLWMSKCLLQKNIGNWTPISCDIWGPEDGKKKIGAAEHKPIELNVEKVWHYQ